MENNQTINMSSATVIEKNPSSQSKSKPLTELTVPAMQPNMTDKEAQQESTGHESEESKEGHAQHPLAQLGNARKNSLLIIFAIASFVDVCNVSGVAVAVAQIGMDTGLKQSQLVWVSFWADWEV